MLIGPLWEVLSILTLAFARTHQIKSAMKKKEERSMVARFTLDPLSSHIAIITFLAKQIPMLLRTAPISMPFVHLDFS